MRIAWTAVFSSCYGFLPVFLFAALSVLIAEDIALTTRDIGTVIALFFASSAVASVPAGRLLPHLGVGRGLALASVLTGISLMIVSLGVATQHLYLLAALAGGSNALAQVAGNELIATNINSSRHGIAYGIKQAAVPTASLLAGASVPLLAVVLGWRMTFLILSLTTAVILVGIPRVHTSLPTAGTGRVPRGDLRTLTLIAMATAIASAAALALPSFLVPAALTLGMSIEDAGVVLTASSLAAIVVRVSAGWTSDAGHMEPLTLAGVLLLLGAAAFFAMRSADQRVFVGGAVVALGCGWGWTGLLIHAVVRHAPSSPSAAMSVVAVGPYLGGVAGPFLAGLVAEWGSYSTVWLFSAAASAVSGASLILIQKRQATIVRSRQLQGEAPR